MGGLLGLGLGFSMISAFELFYLVFVRWCLCRNKSADSSVDLPPTVSYRSTDKLVSVSMDQLNSPLEFSPMSRF